MSPEQCDLCHLDLRSDIYSLGGTYYSSLTGKSPFQICQHYSSDVRTLQCGVPDPREITATVPAACTQIVLRAMAKQPEQRYQTMDEMRADLEAVLAAMSGVGIALPSQSAANLSPQPATPVPVSSRRSFRGAAIAGTALTLVVAAAAFFMFGGGSRDGGTKEAITTGAIQNSPLPSVITPPSGEPIRVGVLHSLTGTMVHSESPVVDATLLSIDEINRNGGLLGVPCRGCGGRRPVGFCDVRPRS